MIQHRIGDIQILRAVAVLFVIINHSRYNQLLPTVFRSGSTGVDLFFVISGFVIMASSLNMRIDTFSRDFLIKRVFRIIPPAAGWLMIYWAALWFVWHRDTTNEVFDILTLRFAYTLTWDAAIGHYWSLVVEEHFYLGFAFLFPVLLRSRGILPFALVGTYLTIAILRPYAGDPAHMTHGRLDSFLVGGALAYIGNTYARRVVDAAPYLATGLAIALLGFIWVSFAVGTWNAYTLVMVASAAAVFIASADRDVVVPIPAAQRLMEWVGERSYSLYLCHPLLMYAEQLLETRVPIWAQVPMVGRAGVLLGAIFLVGDISYRLVERRADLKGKRVVAWVRRTFDASAKSEDLDASADSRIPHQPLEKPAAILSAAREPEASLPLNQIVPLQESNSR